MKRRRWIALSLFISGAALAGLLAATFTPETRAYLGEVGVAALLLALGLRAASILCRMVRIGVLCRGLGYTVPFRSLTVTQFLSLFAGSITPGQVGGEPVRIHRLSHSGLAVGDAVAVVITERVLDLAVFVSLTLAALLAVRHLWSYLAATVFYPVAAFLILVLVLLLALAVLVRRPSFTKRVLGSVASRVLARCGRSRRWLRFCPGAEGAERLAQRVEREAETFAAGSSRFARAGRRAVGGAILISILDWVFLFSTASALLVALGLPPSFPESFLFQGVLQMIAAVPLVPGAAGIAELGAATLYSRVVPTYLLGLFVVLWRLVLYFLNIPLGLLAAALAARETATENL
ncbi:MULTISPECIES: lysylphosphatidylglycerol synthase transmembrane domain-containing protein [unclassified Methanoculleus]|uniref:lysylphosphatidylglycerol synthase transmembrane domain-containing protein n=1 Tax=unclassified Methanoculleus TaxID=2619537 RepID=UPI0025F3827F|nr:MULTISPECIES: flippase-like domain-containing protein [unclassified Methanoculleus]